MSRALPGRVSLSIECSPTSAAPVCPGLLPQCAPRPAHTGHAQSYTVRTAVPPVQPWTPDPQVPGLITTPDARSAGLPLHPVTGQDVRTVDAQFTVTSPLTF